MFEVSVQKINSEYSKTTTYLKTPTGHACAWHSKENVVPEDSSKVILLEDDEKAGARKPIGSESVSSNKYLI